MNLFSNPHYRIRSALYCCLIISIAFLTLSANAAPPGIAALGYIEPEDGIFNVSGAVSPQGNTVAVLYVSEGDTVESGQIIAILNSHDRLQAALNRAEAQSRVQKARLDQFLAGPREGLIKIQAARISQVRAQISIARKQCERFKTLRTKGTVSESEHEESCLDIQTLQPELELENARLTDLQDIREVDAVVLQTQVADAQSAVEQAQGDLERSLVRSPIDGQILQVYTQSGENVTAKGIVGIGRTQQMWVRAEVYENDIENVKVGQQVTVQADGLSTDLSGEVAKIGLLVGRNRVITLDPTASLDARVVEVKIRLDQTSSDSVSALTNLQVSVIIKV
ncbi:MAG: HlyD family efflux transporter periplasmic adaptor subunit [Gammaproteobacteria bacterium]|nr:HlyD family efflux transporter periplasmic adaptor subunit [Gammaproteobacteria bacterium]